MVLSAVRQPSNLKRQVKPSYLSSAAVQRAAFLLSSALRAPATGVAHGPTAQLPQCQPRLSWELPQPALPQCLLAAARQSARSHGGGRRPVLAAISGLRRLAPLWPSPTAASQRGSDRRSQALSLLKSVAAQQNREPEKVFYGVKLLIVFNKIMMKL